MEEEQKICVEVCKVRVTGEKPTYYWVVGISGRLFEVCEVEVAGKNLLVEVCEVNMADENLP